MRLWVAQLIGAKAHLYRQFSENIFNFFLDNKFNGSQSDVGTSAGRMRSRDITMCILEACCIVTSVIPKEESFYTWKLRNTIAGQEVISLQTHTVGARPLYIRLVCPGQREGLFNERKFLLLN